MINIIGWYKNAESGQKRLKKEGKKMKRKQYYLSPTIDYELFEVQDALMTSNITGDNYGLSGYDDSDFEI